MLSKTYVRKAELEGTERSVRTILFELCGQGMWAVNGGPDFMPRPVISQMVRCSSEEAVKDIPRYTGGGNPMEGRMVKGETLSGTRLLVACFTIIASIVPEILFRETSGEVPGWLPYVKILILMGGGLLLFLWKKREDFLRFAAVLTVIIGMQVVTAAVGNTNLWRAFFDRDTFTGNFGGNIFLKVIGIIPVILLLVHFLGTREAAYLSRGDLSLKAEGIRWLGIEKGKISWGKLSVISALLISLGTILLTVLTATGLSRQENWARLLSYLPFVLLFALVNSFCEGVVYRSAILGTLSRILPKNQLILTGALFFGVGHYYGIPSGPLGALMGSLLGWYMLRSMYETRGFLSSWIIHFMQDAVIFSTILLMTGR